MASEELSVLERKTLVTVLRSDAVIELEIRNVRWQVLLFFHE